MKWNLAKVKAKAGHIVSAEAIEKSNRNREARAAKFNKKKDEMLTTPSKIPARFREPAVKAVVNILGDKLSKEWTVSFCMIVK